MMISQTAEYALRAVVHLAAHTGDGNGTLTTQEISEAMQVPVDYLYKVLQSLSRAGLLQSQRGMGGGYRLARAANKMSILEILQAVDPPLRITDCPLNLPEHKHQLCPLHQRLDEAMEYVERAFAESLISELVDSPCALVEKEAPTPA